VDLPFLVRISSSPVLLLLTLVVVTLVCHALFLWWFPLGDVTWKRLDYIWLFAASLGVLASSGRAARFIAENQLKDFQEPITITSYEFLRADIKSGAENSACVIARRSADSPRDFDERVKEEQAMCAQYKKLNAQMPNSVEPPFQPLKQLGFVPLAGNPEYVAAPFEVVNRDAEEYERNRETYDEITQRTKSSKWENAYLAMGPLLVALAVALRITKTTGEIQIARRQSQSAK
jgi:hypothetical protein